MEVEVTNKEINPIVWGYFSFVGDGFKITKCCLCQEEFVVADVTTLDLQNHIELTHGYDTILQNLLEENPPESTNPKVRKPSHSDLLLDFLYDRKLSPQEILSSSFAHQYFNDYNHTLPNIEKDLLLVVDKVYHNVKAELPNKLKQLILDQKKFNLSIEEWPLQDNHLHLTVRVHYDQKESYNLGCLFSDSHSQSEKLFMDIQKRLKLYGISFHKDIAFFNCGESNIVYEAANMSSAYGQYCYNRALQKSLLNILFYEIYVIDEEMNAPPFEHQNCSCEKVSNLLIHYKKVNMAPRGVFEDVVNLIMNIIAILQIPGFVEVLNQCIVDGNYLNLPLFIACPNDWRSISEMMRIFYVLQDPIKRALCFIELEYLWDEPLLMFGMKIVEVFNAYSRTMESLSLESSNLLTAEKDLEVLFSDLKLLRVVLTDSLLLELQNQLKLIRNTVIISLIKFLNNPQHQEEPGFFEMCPESVMFEAGSLMYERLFGNGPVSGKVPPQGYPQPSQSESSEQEPEEPTSWTCDDENSICLTITETQILSGKFNEMENPEENRSLESVSLTQEEFQQYKTTGIRGEKLEALYQVLLSVHPTFSRLDVISSISPKIFYQFKDGFTSRLIHQLNIIKNPKLNE